MRMDTPKGSKGSGGSSPTQADDSLSSVTYAQIMDLISEGPIFGPPTGVPAQSVYLNNVPLMNGDGSTNFNVSAFDFRYGEIDQTYIAGFDSSSNETSVGVELKQVTPWSVTVTDMTVDALVITLGVNSLSQTNTSNGDVTGYEVKYQIQVSVDGGAYSVAVDTSFNGKASSAYQRSHRVALSGAKSQYLVRVVRTTPDTTSVYIQDTTSIVSYAQVVDAKLRYPLSALCALSVDAVQFSSIPTRSYDLKGLLIKYPSNYNPATRAYTGTWDGTFTTGWTDNPAWIFYDLVLNSRYGLGQWVDASMLDRYSLYQIAQYCDVLVSDGQGGQEPRFTCNCYIQSRADAYKVLQDLASVFRGMAYWAAGSVVATSDAPSDPVYVYTAANVVGGQFKYVGSSLKTRYTCALVTWNDPNNAYQQAVEYVEDVDGIARYGINKAQITAFGCTSRGQAQRVGQWSIITSRYETNAVTFSVGLDGTLAQPGQVIAVADPARAARRMGGRINAVSGTAQVTLDRAMPEANVGDTLTVVMPSGVAASSTISGINGAVIHVNPPFSTPPAAQSVWMIESATVQAQLFRVLSVSEKDGIIFEVTASQHEPSKYAAIDNGAAIDIRPITGNTFTTQLPPSNVTVTQYVVVDQGIAKTNMTIAWQAPANGVSYTVQWQKDNGAWVDAGTTGGISLDVSNVYSGSYLARVKATNGMGISSAYAFSPATTLAGKTGLPPTVASLTATTNQVFAVNIGWTFPAGTGDTAYTELYYSHTSDFASAVQQGRYSYPTNNTKLLGLASGYDLFFWARLVDTTGNVGPWYPSSSGAGVHGASSSDATAILTYLTGQITQTQLGQDVLAPIQAVPGLQTSVAANTAAISKETSDRIAAVTAEAQARAQAITDEATARGAAVTSEQTARQAADTSLGQRIDTVTAANGTNAAAIQSETTARTNADSALSSRIDTVTATANANTASIGSEATTRANADSALGTRIDTVTASSNNNAAAITSEATARTNADSALSTRIDSVTATANAATAAISSEATTRAAADSALSTRVDGVYAQLNPPMAGDTSGYAGGTSVYAGVWSEQSARAEADLALAQKTDSVTAQLQTASATLNAAIQTEATARATADSAQASLITTVQATANANTAAVQTVAQSYASLNGQLAASYTIKTQITSGGRTYIAGIGVGVNSSGGVVESQVLVSASTFAVIDPNGTAVSSPFTIVGGQTYINQAFIGTGWITNAMIGQTIQSTAVGANGQPLWILDKANGLTLNGPNGGSGYLNLNSSTLTVYDNNGTLRVRLGLW
jgi:predicted phage tail protein